MNLSPDLFAACLVPRRVSGPDEVREVVAADGAAIISGITDEEAAIAFGRAMLGDELIRIGRQIEATATRAAADGRKVEGQPVDARGRPPVAPRCATTPTWRRYWDPTRRPSGRSSNTGRPQ